MSAQDRADQRHAEELHRRERAKFLAQEACRAYNRVRFRALLRRAARLLLGRPTALPCGQELLRRATPLAARPRAVEHIALCAVIGSEGRSHDFDPEFAPIQAHTGARWQWIALTWLQGAPLEPVRLIQIGGQYLVRDGHHRVSVARAFGADTIEAIVEQSFAPPAPAEICLAAEVCVG